MQEKVLAILERELDKLDQQSQKSILELDDFRRLDLLLKAHRTLTAQPPKSDDPPADTPESASTEELLTWLQIDQSK